MKNLIEMEHVTVTYRGKNKPVTALCDVSFSVNPGELCGIIGHSGAGKSTLTGLLGCLARQTGGCYRFCGRDVAALSPAARAALRAESIGFVFQNYRLLPDLSAVENVELPLLYRGVPSATRRRRALSALAAVGLESRAFHRPFELSGGQEQRVAVARALVTRPKLLLADEPTGNLDRDSAEQILQLLTRWNARGNTVVLVTHDPAIVARLPRVLRLENGHLIEP